MLNGKAHMSLRPLFHAAIVVSAASGGSQASVETLAQICTGSSFTRNSDLRITRPGTD